MASPRLEKKIVGYALSFKGQKQRPAVVVGAEYSYYKKVDSSKPIAPNTPVKKLRKQLLTLGELYTKVNGNSIGCCAEVNAGNQILTIRPHLDLKQIRFSKAIRPRTMQKIPQCKNCKLTFK